LPPAAGGVVLGVVLLAVIGSFGETETAELLAVVFPVLVAMVPVDVVTVELMWVLLPWELVAACVMFVVLVTVTVLLVVW